VDPPRAGLSEKAIIKLNDFSPAQIIYVSCNPATLARDLKIFSEFGYDIKEVKAVDMFPHTYHIETVVLIEKNL
jgi:tRNA/tmRNA/rRNA uracil-C5-methylase (TrmA/RlmC/RlmD family)